VYSKLQTLPDPIATSEKGHERAFWRTGGPQESVTHDAATPACGVRRLHDEYILKRDALWGDQGVMTETAASFLRAKGKVKGAS
jgi:hypothetical protein